MIDGQLATALLAALTEAVYVVDTDRRITYWNPAAERITGWSAEEVVGRRCRDGILNHVDDDGRSLCGRQCPLLLTMEDGATTHARPFLHHRAGHRLPVVVSAAPLYDASGRIAGAVEAFHDDSQFRDLAENFAEAERKAMTDPLTGLGNRRMLDATIARLDEDRHRFGAHWAALFVDIDDFKAVNDRFGHDAGDAVLRNVAATLRGTCRSGDIVGRWGGDEFVVVLPTDDDAFGAAQARRVGRMLGASAATAGDAEIQITASIGVAVMRPDEAAAETVARADAAMLVAKANGRDQVYSA